jgi:hypothetical protein
MITWVVAAFEAFKMSKSFEACQKINETYFCPRPFLYRTNQLSGSYLLSEQQDLATYSRLETGWKAPTTRSASSVETVEAMSSIDDLFKVCFKSANICLYTNIHARNQRYQIASTN